MISSRLPARSATAPSAIRSPEFQAAWVHQRCFNLGSRGRRSSGPAALCLVNSRDPHIGTFVLTPRAQSNERHMAFHSIDDGGRLNSSIRPSWAYTQSHSANAVVAIGLPITCSRPSASPTTGLLPTGRLAASTTMNAGPVGDVTKCQCDPVRSLALAADPKPQ